MRDLIRKILREEVDRMTIEKMVKNYAGNSPFLKDMWVKQEREKENLNSDELNLIQSELEKEGLIKLGKQQINTILPNIKKELTLQSEIKKYGIQTYLDLIKSNKKYLLESLFGDSKFKIGSPSEGWYKKNIDDLNTLKSTFKSTAGDIKWMDKTKSTFEDKINELIKKCVDKDYWGILETENGIDTWSLLNKIDTNYINWGELIKERQENGHLNHGNDKSIIKEYFKQRPVSEALKNNELLKKLDKIEEKNKIKIKTLSYAEVDVLDAFHDIVGPKLEGMFKRITKTTEDGDFIENRFIELIENLDTKYVKDIHNFSTWGNIVDMVFGVDLIANLHGHNYAIQVKKNETHTQNAFIKKLGIPYILIYPKSLSQAKKYQFEYISNNKHGNFNSQFNRNIPKEIPKEPEIKKGSPSHDYVSYMGWDK